MKTTGAKELRQQGIFSLADVATLGSTSLWHKHWKNGRFLHLDPHQAKEWNSVILKQERDFIGFSKDEDSLIWSKNPVGIYTTKLGYIASFLQEQSQIEW